MRILVVSQYYWPEPFRLSDICEELAGRGHEVHVLTDLPNYPDGKIHPGYHFGRNRLQQRNGVTIHRTFTIGRRRNILFRVLNYYSFALCAVNWAKWTRKKFDIVLAYQSSPVMMAGAAIAYGKKHGVPVLLYCMDLWPDSLRVGGIQGGSRIYRHFHMVSERIYRNAQEIAVSSRDFTDYLCCEFGIEAGKISYIPQYADNCFDIRPKEPGKTLELVLAGNVGAAQSIPTVLEAARRLKGKAEILWHIVGGGSALERSKQMARRYGLDNVFFHGQQTREALQGFYERADAMLVTLTADPVISRTLPMRLMSCLGSGKPIIASADGAIPAVISEARCGCCAPAEDGEALAGAVLRFLEEPDWAAMGRNARKYYEAHFTRACFMDQLEQKLLALAEGGR